jgi:hypothetical protein
LLNYLVIVYASGKKDEISFRGRIDDAIKKVDGSWGYDPNLLVNISQSNLPVRETAARAPSKDERSFRPPESVCIAWCAMTIGSTSSARTMGTTH